MGSIHARLYSFGGYIFLLRACALYRFNISSDPLEGYSMALPCTGGVVNHPRVFVLYDPE